MRQLFKWLLYKQTKKKKTNANKTVKKTGLRINKKKQILINKVSIPYCLIFVVIRYRLFHLKAYLQNCLKHYFICFVRFLWNKKISIQYFFFFIFFLFILLWDKPLLFSTFLIVFLWLVRMCLYSYIACLFTVFLWKPIPKQS